MSGKRGLSFALFSGGHDSLCSTHAAMTGGLASEVVHVNTGIGIEPTRTFVRETCREHGWPLIVVHPPVSYREIVLRGGFPGPAQHFTRPGAWVGIQVQLKERALAAFARERKPKRGTAFVYVTGVRKQESDQRWKRVAEWQPAPKLGWTWHAPIWSYSKRDVNAYIAEHGLRRNEVVDTLHMSGECLCGCYAHPGEREELRLWYPEVDAQIAALEAAARAAGHHACVWGQRPPNVHRDQLVIEDGEGMLCASCSPFALAAPEPPR